MLWWWCLYFCREQTSVTSSQQLELVITGSHSPAALSLSIVSISTMVKFLDPIGSLDFTLLISNKVTSNNNQFVNSNVLMCTMRCYDDVMLWWCYFVFCDNVMLLWWCNVVVMMLCCEDVMLWWCKVVVMMLCWWCYVVMMLCCCDGVMLLWWCYIICYIVLMTCALVPYLMS